MTRADLDEFVKCYNPENRNQRKPTWDEKKHPEGRWRVFTYDEIVARDKCSLDIFWLKDESLEDSANLPEPHVLAEEIADDLRSALEQIESVLADLQQRAKPSEEDQAPEPARRPARTTEEPHVHLGADSQGSGSENSGVLPNRNRNCSRHLVKWKHRA